MAAAPAAGAAGADSDPTGDMPARCVDAAIIIALPCLALPCLQHEHELRYYTYTVGILDKHLCSGERHKYHTFMTEMREP